MNELKVTMIGGADVHHLADYSDDELNLVFRYLYRMQSLRYDQDTSLSGLEHYTIRPSEEDTGVWEFVSLNDDIPVCITPEFELKQMMSMAKTAMTVMETLRDLRMENVAI
jgi:hypothetical protein